MKIRLRGTAMYDYRTEIGISRDELSRRMGVATTTAFRVEKGESEPSPKFIAALISTTGLKFEDLFVIDEDDEVAAAVG